MVAPVGSSKKKEIKYPHAALSTPTVTAVRKARRMEPPTRRPARAGSTVNPNAGKAPSARVATEMNKIAEKFRV